MSRWSVLWLALFVLPLLAQPPANSAKQSAKPAAKSAALTVDSVVAMVEAGLSDDLIITRLRKESQAFDLSADDLIRLKKAKVSDAVLKVMLDPKAEISPAPAPQPAPVEHSADSPSPATQPGPPSPSAPEPPRKKFGNPFSKLKEAAVNSLTGKTVLDSVGLRNILPQIDPDKSLMEQFPHVAVTVLKAPSMWADSYRQKTNVLNDCFKLQARVWDDAEHSRVVGPFDWCLSHDARVTSLEPGYLLTFLPPVKDVVSRYLTGINRSEGPAPPSTLLPTDRETQELESLNSSRGEFTDLNKEFSSRFALLFANLRAGMGETLSISDFRVWIVAIKK